MNFSTITSYIQQRRQFSGKEYLLHTIAYNLAPVVERHKPSTILSFTANQQNLCALWDEHKGIFPVTSQLAFQEVKRTKGGVSVLFYNPRLLKETVEVQEVACFLKSFGYREDMSLQESLDHLSTRFTDGCPHEIGIFLGIPLLDVISFIKHNGQNCVECGYWKVYHNPQQAKKIFASYEEAKYKFMQYITSGYHPKEYLESYAC